MARDRRPLDHSTSPAGKGRRRNRLLGAAAATAAVVAMLLSTAIASASVPATVGFRDFGYAGSQATRVTSDPEQSKLWYNDGSWWGGLFVSSGRGSGGSHFNIYRYDTAATPNRWVDTTVRIDARDHSHADYFWDQASNKLYVASSKSICDSVFDGAQPCNDSIRIYRFSYNAASATKYSLDAGFPKGLAGGGFTGPNFTGGGSNAVTITKDSAGTVWVAFTRDDPTTAAPPITGFHSNVYINHSADGGLTWSGNTRFAGAADGELGEDNTASIVAFGGNKVGLYWTETHSAGADNAFFAVHNDGDDPATWSSNETVVTGTSAIDNQANVKADSTGKVYVVAKTASNLVRLFDRTTGGTWTAHTVSNSTDDMTRAQVVIDEQLGLAYVFSSSGGTTAGTIYVKAASLSALTFPSGKGTAFIKSAIDPAIDDVTLTKQTVNSTTGILAEASDRTTFEFLHGEMTLAATDATAPVGTVSINGGAAFTASTAVTLTVPASDPGSGVAQVRVANDDATVDGNGALSGTGATSFSYTPSIPWTLASSDGLRTVYVQWRDQAGNWSPPISDAITLDQTGPVGSVTINGGATETASATVSLNVTATDAGVGTVSNVRIANAGSTSGGLLNDASAVTSAYAPTKSWNLTAGADGTREVWVQWQDALGNWSAPSSDTITFHDTVPPVGHVAINGGAAGVHTLNVTLSFPSTGADVTEVMISNSPSMAGATFRAFAPSIAWTLSGSLTSRSVHSVYVVFKDGAGHTSDLIAGTAYSASDSVVVDLTKPSIRGAVVTGWRSATTLIGTTVPLKVTWPAATDTITGVGSYRVWISTDGHAFVFAATATSRTFTKFVSAGHTYRFRIYGVDRAGNGGNSIYSPTVRMAAYQESSRSIIYRGSWHTSSSVGYYGGKAKYTTSRGASASLRFTGRSIAWNAVLASNRGSARVYIDGRLITTVNLHAATTTTRRLVFSRTWTSSGTHTIKVIALSARTDVDSFFVLR